MCYFYANEKFIPPAKRMFSRVYWIQPVCLSMPCILVYTCALVILYCKLLHLCYFCMESLLFNPFPNKPWFFHVCSTSLLKTLWKNEKLIVMSSFSFSHCVFYPFGKLGKLNANFAKFEIDICKLVQFGRV